ncbi:type II toxin-antitoxin system PemK/MazF family toxin [Streptomyces fractus]|uniref:type II toxin-antitoxin system PemK/MazF family toxin n=1 Tax=Streptomyces fractus TaxID=641806 RepID=UPI003CE998E3
MDTSWWLALAAVVLLALVATLVDGWGRGTRHRRRDRHVPRSAHARGPEPGDIWWALVPYEDGPESKGPRGARRVGRRRVTGGKDRPCLVLSVRRGVATVAKITSRYHDERPGVIALPPGSVGDARGRASFLETDELRTVPVSDFRRPAGVIDPGLWDQVRHLGT